MMDEQLQSLIDEHRRTAEAAGQAALAAMGRGDIGLARQAARQAAQWARVVMQLETGERQSGPPDEAEASETPGRDSGKMVV
jgi:hypothetical protein